MHRVEVKREMAADDIASVSQLLDVAAAHDGHRPLGEHQWLDLVQGGREGFAGLVALQPGHSHPVGYAQVSRGPSSWALELVVDPHHRHSEREIGGDLLVAALDVVRSEGGGHLHLWVPKPREAVDQMAAEHGLARGRDLLQMRVRLPLSSAVRARARSLELRPFTDADADEWLSVNNRAFAHHPEQGHWTAATLADRRKEPWFDAEGFLLHERDGRLAGFCWTKVHADHDPPLGEIYVIAVDPDFQGLGLGRDLVVAGLDHLAARGLTDGMLYVDASNEAAVSLYEALGFAVDHLDRAYVADIAPA